MRDVKDFSSVRCAKSCLMLAVKTRIVSLTKDNEIDVNTAGKKFNHLISRIFLYFSIFKVHEMSTDRDEERSGSRRKVQR